MPWMEGTVDRGRTNAICIATEGRREHVRDKCSTTATCSRARLSCLKFTPPGANKYGAGVVSEQPLTHEISTDIYSQFSSCVPKIISASLFPLRVSHFNQNIGSSATQTALYPQLEQLQCGMFRDLSGFIR